MYRKTDKVTLASPRQHPGDYFRALRLMPMFKPVAFGVAYAVWAEWFDDNNGPIGVVSGLVGFVFRGPMDGRSDSQRQCPWGWIGYRGGFNLRRDFKTRHEAVADLLDKEARHREGMSEGE